LPYSPLTCDDPVGTAADVDTGGYGVLKAVMNTAVADDLIDANPCRIRGASNAPRARDVRPATVEELAVIVEAMPDRYRALVLLGAWCALGSGEMLELRRRDVDLVNGTVRVERAVSQATAPPSSARRSPAPASGRWPSRLMSCRPWPPPGGVHRAGAGRPAVPGG